MHMYLYTSVYTSIMHRIQLVTYISSQFQQKFNSMGLTSSCSRVEWSIALVGKKDGRREEKVEGRKEEMNVKFALQCKNSV